MYFRCKTSSEADHCVLVKGLTPSNEYIYLSFSNDRQKQYSIQPGGRSPYTTPLKYYCYDGRSAGYSSLLEHLLSVPHNGDGTETITVYDRLGNPTSGDIVLCNQYSDQVSVHNRTSNSIDCAYIKVKIPEVFYSLTSDGSDTTLRLTTANLYYKGTSNAAFCSDSYSPWSYNSIHVTDLKFFNSRDEEVPFVQSESVYLYRNGNYIKLFYNSNDSITAAYVKFKFPWPELA